MPTAAPELTRYTAETITNFGILVVLAALCIVGAGVALYMLVRLVFSNYKELNRKVEQLNRELKIVHGEQRDEILDQLRVNTTVLGQLSIDISKCPALATSASTALAATKPSKPTSRKAS